MRLLCLDNENESKGIKLEEYLHAVPNYACLSHRWNGNAEYEVSYQDVKSNLEGAQTKPGYPKIPNTLKQAAAEKESPKHVWIDTCCIDKSNGAEISEEINSMYRYYQECTVCVAYMDDVENDDPYKEGSSFRKSAWFERGWTLQELIAPPKVMFFAKDWSLIGDRNKLAGLIEEITNIQQRVLKRSSKLFDLKRFSVATKMSWAANRQTTKVEDRAYSLLGIFEINMPTIYGEGERAFERLQKKILKLTDDQSIFAWGKDQMEIGEKSVFGMIATSPDHFSGSRDIASQDYDEGVLQKYGGFPNPEYSLSNFGLKIQLLVVPIPDLIDIHVAVLKCRYQQDNKAVVMFLGSQAKSTFAPVRYSRISFNRQLTHIANVAHMRLELKHLWISGTERQLQSVVAPKDVVLRFPERYLPLDDTNPREFWRKDGGSRYLTLPVDTWSTTILRDWKNNQILMAIGSIHTTVWFTFRFLRDLEVGESVAILHERLNILQWSNRPIEFQVAPGKLAIQTPKRGSFHGDPDTYTMTIGNREARANGDVLDLTEEGLDVTISLRDR
ncbi:hypothetical protein N431DRAFT_426617 [Stipitochalara longipes BDJ]|nr:hypothetical protein N431DRAFT_426617 [Stipitochalara longipes BDJ]